MRRLEAVLADLMARTGAQAARIVDMPTAAVIAEVDPAMAGSVGIVGVVGTVGTVGTADNADSVAGLVRLADQAAQVAGPDGGLDDLVVGTRRAVHVLRAIADTAYLHLRLDPARDGLTVARRWLADPSLHQAIMAVLRPALHHRSPTPRSAATVPTPVVVPSPRSPGIPDGPALTVLSPDVRARSTGALAVLALGPPLMSQPATGVGLPRRATSAQPSVPEVLDRAWSRDADTLRRILAGLHRLA